MKGLSNTLYHEVATFSATVDAEIGDCLQRKVDELTDIIAALAVQVDPARSPEGGTASAQLPQRAEIARQANERLDRLEASLQECDRVAQARQGPIEPIPRGGQHEGGRGRRALPSFDASATCLPIPSLLYATS
jgi:hypothetical protein